MVRPKKKTPVKIKSEFDERFAAHGVSDEEIRTAKEEGYSVAFLYETKGLTLDQWQKVWFAFRASKEEDMTRVMGEAVKSGNARNNVRVEF